MIGCMCSGTNGHIRVPNLDENRYCFDHPIYSSRRSNTSMHWGRITPWCRVKNATILPRGYSSGSALRPSTPLPRTNSIRLTFYIRIESSPVEYPSTSSFSTLIFGC
jgi:hypothetical protein